MSHLIDLGNQDGADKHELILRARSSVAGYFKKEENTHHIYKCYVFSLLITCSIGTALFGYSLTSINTTTYALS